MVLELKQKKKRNISSVKSQRTVLTHCSDKKKILKGKKILPSIHKGIMLFTEVGVGLEKYNKNTPMCSHYSFL